MLLLYMVYDKMNKQNKADKIRGYWLFATGMLYLIPLRGLKGYYRMLWRYLDLASLNSTFRFSYYDESQDYLKWKIASQTVRNTTYQFELTIYAVWITVTIVVLAIRVGRSLYYKKNIVQMTLPETDTVMGERLDKLRKESGIRRKVRLCYYEGSGPISFGICKPVILMPFDWKDTVPDAVLRHELMHIKRFDTLSQLLTHLVCSIHWFNPLIYVYQRQLIQYCECRCDYYAVRDCDEKERSSYARLLVRTATNKEREHRKESRFSNSFARQNSNKRQITERIENIMKRDKSTSRWKKSISAAALIVSMSISSMTVFAYDDVEEFEAIDVNVGENRKANMEYDADIEACFASEANTLFSASEQKVIYDEQFTDTQGNVFEANPDYTPHIICFHDYVDGYYTSHAKFPDGSCKVEQYIAQQCKWCDKVLVYEWISTHTYATCPH